MTKMKVQYTGINPTWIDASWSGYDPGTDRMVGKGRNFGRVNPGDIFDVDYETAAKLLEQPGFVRPIVQAEATDTKKAPVEQATESTEVTLRP